MSEYLFKIGDFTPTGPVDPKFQVGLSYGIKICIDFSSVLSQSSRLRLTERRTDGRTDRHLLATRPPCVQCSAVKTKVDACRLCPQFQFPFSVLDWLGSTMSGHALASSVVSSNTSVDD